jgi:hypothetical protein
MAKTTDDEKLAAAQALDRAYAEAEAFDAERSEERKLDAYGHLTWTLGDENWMACFDAVRIGSEIAYHVVVNCESGGFIDTIEKGVVRADKALGLIGLPGQYVDIGLEGHYVTQSENSARPRSQRIPLGRFAYRDCEKRWARHIRQLIKQEPEPEPEEDSDEMGDLRKAALNRGQP